MTLLGMGHQQRGLRPLDGPNRKTERYDFEVTVKLIPPEIHSNEKWTTHGNRRWLALQPTEKSGAVFLRKRIVVRKVDSNLASAAPQSDIVRPGFLNVQNFDSGH